MSVTSDAAQLLRREYRLLTRNPLEGIAARPCDADSLRWDVEIHGLTGSLWQGSILHARLQFPMTYNCLPPVVEFVTIPFHPNVDARTGRVCLRLLDDDHCWGACAAGGVATVLLAVQQLLSEPELDNAVNSLAAAMLLHARQEYIAMADSCVIASQELAAQQSAWCSGDTEQPPQGTSLPAPAPETAGALDKKVRFADMSEQAHKDGGHIQLPGKAPATAAVAAKAKAKSVSYIDYLELWRGTATTRPEPGSRLPHADVLMRDPALRQQHLHLSHRQMENATVERLKYYNSLKYGKVSSLAETVASKSTDGRNFHLDRLVYAAELGRTASEDKERALHAIAAKISEQTDRHHRRHGFPALVPAVHHSLPATVQRAGATRVTAGEPFRNRGNAGAARHTAMTASTLLQPAAPLSQAAARHPRSPPIFTIPPPTTPVSRLAENARGASDGFVLKAGELPDLELSPRLDSDSCRPRTTDSRSGDSDAEAAELIKWSRTLVDDGDV